MTNQAYKELMTITREAGTLDSITELLTWDQEVTMQEKEAAVRAKQIGVVSKLSHDLSTQARVGELLKELASARDLTEEQERDVIEIGEGYQRERRIPSELVGVMAEKESEGAEIWKKAEETSDFKMFLPILTELYELKRRVADAIDPNEHPYQVMFDEWEGGMRLSELDNLFGTLRDGLVPLIRAVGEKEQPDTSILEKRIPHDIQLAITREVVTAMGYDFRKGRLDTVENHPFTAAFRITTRFKDGWYGTISTAIHEAGHGMYDQNLPEEHLGLPRGTHRSLGVHESQSRIWENQVGKSREFMEYLIRLSGKRLGLGESHVEELYRATNCAKPVMIRINSDELTYNMHIILRYEMEKDLFEGKLKLSDFPEVFNAKMEEYLGIVPENDSEGVLQDCHWSEGAFGYFPTYIIGSALAAQLFKAVENEHPNVKGSIRKGEFENIAHWLKENIQKHGQRYKTRDLIVNATGKQFGPEDYLEYLVPKFSEIYGL